MAKINFPKKQEQRLIPKHLLDYAEELQENHPDPSASWGGSGSTYTAGDGIDIDNNVISVDNTVALKTDIPDVSDFVTSTELSTELEDYELKSEAFSGSYNDLSNKPDLTVYELKTDAFTGNYNDLTNKPDLSVYELKTDAFSGNYNDLTNKPTIPTKTSDLTNDSGFITGVTWNDVTNKPTFATVATSGSYDDLTNKPTIPTVPTNVSAFTNDAGYITGIDSSDVITALGYTPGTSNFDGAYNSLTGKPDLSVYAETSDLATVATTGAYSDLTGTPTIPAAVSGTNDGTNWTSLTIGNDTYGLASGSTPSNMVTTNTTQTITGAKTFTTNPLDIVNTEKGIKLHSGTNNSTSSKLGFTLYNSIAGSSNYEVGFLESNTNTVANNGHSTLLGYYNTANNTNYRDWDLGFAYNGYNTTKGGITAYKLMIPNQYNLNSYTTKRYIPIDFKNGNTIVRSDATGIVNLSSLMPTVPTKTSDLTNDSGYITNSVNNLTNYTLTSALSTVATSGDYDDLLNKPTIPTVPTNVSAFTNDAGYITNSALLDYVSLDDIYYKDGDTFTFSYFANLSGYLTSAGKTIQFNVTTPKLLTGVSSITVDNLYAVLRGVGGYVNGSSYIDYANTTGYTVTTYKATDNMITIVIDATNAYSSGTNNTPISLAFNPSNNNALKLTFNT